MAVSNFLGLGKTVISLLLFDLEKSFIEFIF